MKFQDLFSRIICAQEFTADTSFDYIQKGGAILNAGVIKAISNSTFEGNAADDYGQDIYGNGEATTLIRDTKFLTPETDGKPRVVGPILACNSPTNLTICPAPTEKCSDTKQTESSMV